MAAAPPLSKQRWWAFYMTISRPQTGLSGDSRAPQPPKMKRQRKEEQTKEKYILSAQRPSSLLLHP